MILRPARASDALSVAGVHVRAWQAAYVGLLPQDYLDGLRAEDRAARYTFGGGWPDDPEISVAIDGETICGFASICPSRDADAPDAGEVASIYVDPLHWGAGLGRLLMADARDRLVGHGFRSAVLWVLLGNERAERFYGIDGWHADGSQRHEEVHGVPADVVRWQRPLP